MTDLLSQGQNLDQSLPDGWATTTVGDLYTMVGGGTPDTKKPEYWDGEIPWISSADIHGLKEVTPRRSVTQLGIESSATNLVPEGSLIVVTRVGLGKVAIAPADLCFSQDSQALVGNDQIFPEYALHYLSTAAQSFKHQSRGTTISGVTKKQLSELPFLLPPLNEQRRIVEKIEELFTKLDAGVRSLKQSQALLKSYRRSVLKAAVEGELSREWREAHRGELEPASELLARILQERREKFSGKKYKEPASPDTSELPALPEGWEWARLDSLASIKGGITKDSKRRYEDSRSVPYLRVANVQRGYLDLSELKEIEASEDVIEQLLLKPGDVLFTEGGDRDKLGRGWIWSGEVAECIHQNHVFRARLYGADVEPKFVSWFGNTFGQVWFMEQGKQTTNLASINLTKLSAFPVPLPPLEEQRFIVEEVERRLSVVDKLEATVEANLKQADALRQSILKQAFSGQLVPQDPDDEPASVLLERIREERQATKQKAGNKRARAKRKVPAGDQTLKLFPEQGV